MNTQYALAQVYLGKLYQQKLITCEEMEQLDREMRRIYKEPDSADGRWSA